MLEIFQFDFMIRAFIAGSVIAIIAPLVGIFLVVRRYALIADTLAHITFFGVVVGFMSGLPPLLTALGTSLAAVFGIERLRTVQNLPSDSLLSLFLSGSLAIATVLISMHRGFNLNLFSFLFGSITTVSHGDIITILVLAVFVIGVIIAFYKELFFISFNEDLAQASGIRPRSFGILLLVLAACTVVVSLKIVGALLISALMVIPVLAAIGYGRGFLSTTILAVFFSLASVIGGIFISYFWGLSSGGTIVCLALAIFVISIFINSK